MTSAARHLGRIVLGVSRGPAPRATARPTRGAALQGPRPRRRRALGLSIAVVVHNRMAAAGFTTARCVFLDPVLALELGVRALIRVGLGRRTGLPALVVHLRWVWWLTG